MPTAADHALEFVPHGDKVDDFAFDFSVMSARNRIDRTAWFATIIG